MKDFFIVQRVKARAIPCPHQPPTRGDNIVLVAQGITATPGTTKQLLPPDRVFKRIIYINTHTHTHTHTHTYIYVYIHIYIYIFDSWNLDCGLWVSWCFFFFKTTIIRQWRKWNESRIEKIQSKNRGDVIGIFTCGCKCVRVCGYVGMLVWIIVTYQCVYVQVCLSEGTNAAHCFNRT